MRVEVINTGSELLLGQVINTNVAFLGQKLAELGIKIERQSSVPDGAIIKNILLEAINRSELIIITGGLGPTHDDVSKEMAAELLDIELEEDLETLEQIRKKIESNGSKMRKINAKQAMVPKGAVILKNKRASISLVQRHLRVGYNRAARLLDAMEAAGVVSQMQSNGNREILVSSGK